MEFRQMLSFQKVAQLKSFSKASKILFLSQPTITSHILELEKELDVKLLIRSNSYVDLTETGNLFLSYVNQIIALQNEGRNAIESLKKGNIGTLKLAFSGAESYWLFPLLDKFKAYYSDAEMALFIMFRTEIIEKVLNREIHFGIVRDENPFFAHPLLTTVLVEVDEAILVFSANHRFAQLNEIMITDISKEPFIAYGKNSSYWEKQLLPIFHKEGVEPNVCVESSDHQAVKQLLKSSWGVAFLSRCCVQEELDKGILKTLPIKNCPLIKRYMMLIYRRDTIMNEASKSFLHMMTRYGQSAHDLCSKSANRQNRNEANAHL